MVALAGLPQPLTESVAANRIPYIYESAVSGYIAGFYNTSSGECSNVRRVTAAALMSDRDRCCEQFTIWSRAGARWVFRSGRCAR